MIRLFRRRLQRSGLSDVASVIGAFLVGKGGCILGSSGKWNCVRVGGEGGYAVMSKGEDKIG